MSGAAGSEDAGPDLGALLRGWRLGALLTQEDVARRSGLSIGTVAGLEAGRTRQPRGATVRLLAEVLELTAEQRRALAEAARRTDAEPAPAPATTVTAARLPPPVSGLTGRDAELAALDRALADSDPDDPALIAITGVAGVGKTALVVHWAHRVAEHFPDGRLHVDLRGFGPGPPEDPAAVLPDLLRALDVPVSRLPADPGGQLDLYRRLLAGRRTLVVLDNARDSAHARPLLPVRSPGVVVVTSRNQLSGLVTAHGARALPLEVLGPAPARSLIAHRLGPDRVGAEPGAVDRIVTRCAGLPLALAAVAAQAALRPRESLDALAGELDRPDGGLAPLPADETGADLRAVFSWSYEVVGPAARRLFRLLGLLPRPQFRTATAADLAGVPEPDARRLLAELVAGNLVQHRGPDLFGLHDLLAAHAAALLAEDDPAARRDGVRRLLDHLAQSVRVAVRCCRPGGRVAQPPDPAPGVTVPGWTTLDEAVAWFESEHGQLLPGTELAAAEGHHEHAWYLAAVSGELYDRRGNWAEWAAVLAAGLVATTDPARRAELLRLLGRPHSRIGRLDDAVRYVGEALHTYRELGDLAGEAACHRNLASLRELAGRPEEALACAERALELFGRAGDDAGWATALSNVGWFSALAGDLPRALAACEEALALHVTRGDAYGSAATWDSLGYVRHRMGEQQEAARCYEHAVALYRELADRYNEADSLTHLGDARDAAGEPEPASAAWRRALDILDDLGHADAAALRDRLRAAAGAG